MGKFGRKLLRVLHRWLGLSSGLIVFIVSLTGFLYTFQDEIRDVLEPWRKVEERNQPCLLPSVLREAALKIYPDLEAKYVIYVDKNRSAKVLLLGKNTFHYIFLDPYTGQFLHDQHPKNDFFTIIMLLHTSLLLPSGHIVVGVAVLIFVILLASGIIMWWPKRKSDYKRSFKIKWNAKWRRVVYDLHNVLGFYVCFFALVIAITGLAFSFKWVRSGLHHMANLGKQYPSEQTLPRIDTSVVSIKKPMVDWVYQQVRERSGAPMLVIEIPSKSTDPFKVTAYAEALYFYKSDRYYFNPNSGKLLKAELHETKSNGLKLDGMHYDLHTGQLFGMLGKIIAFLSSLVCASLPITGFIIWRSRNKKRQNKKTATVRKIYEVG